MNTHLVFGTGEKKKKTLEGRRRTYLLDPSFVCFGMVVRVYHGEHALMEIFLSDSERFIQGVFTLFNVPGTHTRVLFASLLFSKTKTKKKLFYKLN